MLVAAHAWQQRVHFTSYPIWETVETTSLNGRHLGTHRAMKPAVILTDPLKVHSE